MKSLTSYRLPLKAILLYVVCPAMTMAVMGMSNWHQQQKRTTALEVYIDNPEASKFLEETDVRTLIGAEQNITDLPASDVNLSGIENKLLATEYARKVQAWFAENGTLKVQLQLRRPIARFLDNNRNSFYLDDRLTVMPLHRDRTARTLMVYGYCTEEQSAGATTITQPAKGLLPIIDYIDKSKTLKKQISDVFVHPDGRVTLIPEFGNLPIELGQPIQTDKKLKNLEHFLKHALPKLGWQNYNAIELSYAGQIVAKKKQAQQP